MCVEELDAWVKKMSRGKKRLPKQTELELFALYKEGTEKEREAAKAELLEYNILPIVSLALNVKHSFPSANRMDVMDLIGRGIEVFLFMLPKFDPSKARLVTYVTRNIKTQMQRLVMKYALSLPIGSVYLQHLAYRRSLARKALEQELGRAPNEKEEADYMEVSTETLKSITLFTEINVNSLEDLKVDVRNESSTELTEEAHLEEAALLGSRIPVRELKIVMDGIVHGAPIPSTTIDQLKREHNNYYVKSQNGRG